MTRSRLLLSLGAIGVVLLGVVLGAPTDYLSVSRVCFFDDDTNDSTCFQSEATAPAGQKILKWNLDPATCSADAGGGALTINGSDEIVCSGDAGAVVGLPASDDQVIVSDSASASTWRSVADCDDSGGNHLNYDTTANTFSCGTTSSTKTSATLGPFYVPDVAGTATTQAQLGIWSLTAAVLTFSLTTNDVKIQAASHVVGLLAVADAARTAGTATFKVRIAGTGTSFHSDSVVLDATNTLSDSDLVLPASGLAVTAGQTVGCEVVTSGFTPALTDNLLCSVVVVAD